MNETWAAISDLLPQLIESLYETAIMLGFGSVAAILLGLPVGTLLFLTASGRPLSESPWSK